MCLFSACPAPGSSRVRADLRRLGTISTAVPRRERSHDGVSSVSSGLTSMTKAPSRFAMCDHVRGIDDGGCADDEANVAAGGRLVCPQQIVFVEAFSEQNDVRAHRVSTGRAYRRPLFFWRSRYRLEIPARHTASGINVAVQLDQILRSCIAMQAVDVLRDQGDLVEVAARLRRGDRSMGVVRSTFLQHTPPIIEPFPDKRQVLIDHSCRRQLGERHTAPGRSRTAKRRNSGFGRDAGTGQDDKAARARYLFARASNCGFSVHLYFSIIVRPATNGSCRTDSAASSPSRSTRPSTLSGDRPRPRRGTAHARSQHSNDSCRE